MPGSVDLNSDLGESYGAWRLGDDAAMLEVVTSANIACGFHAGDPLTIRHTVETAAERGVVIGAQVGYPDLVGFGRRFLEMAPAELAAAVIYQIGALDGLARAAGSSVRYVKPHGALYNAVVGNEEQAAAVASAVADYDRMLPVVVLPGSALLTAASTAGLPTVTEAFADRGYLADGTLVPRSQPGAVLTDPELVAERALRIVIDGTVAATDGGAVSIHAGTLCVHGDTPGAVDLARALREMLLRNDVRLAPFVE